jgi:hypothetical protein
MECEAHSPAIVPRVVVALHAIGCVTSALSIALTRRLLIQGGGSSFRPREIRATNKQACGIITPSRAS